MEGKKQLSTKSIILVGMFAAVLAVMSQVAIPMPSGVPMTLQTFAVALAGAVLGWKLGALSALVYLLLGAAGVPVFSGMSGGLGVLLGKTGGFIFGFVFMALLCGLGAAQKNKGIRGICGLAGLAVCHVLGVLQFMVLTQVSFVESAVLVSVPFLLKGIVSVALAFVIGEILRKALNAANILTYAKKA